MHTILGFPVVIFVFKITEHVTAVVLIESTTETTTTTAMHYRASLY